jgi:hypothetical protein
MPKQRQKQKEVLDDTDSDTEGFGTENEGSSASAMLDTSDQSWSTQEFDPNKSNRNSTRKQTPEQNWARIFNIVYIAMHMSYKETYPHCSPIYPFEPDNCRSEVETGEEYIMVDKESEEAEGAG